MIKVIVFNFLPAGAFNPEHICTATVDTGVKGHSMPHFSSTSELHPATDPTYNTHVVKKFTGRYTLCV